MFTCYLDLYYFLGIGVVVFPPREYNHFSLHGLLRWMLGEMGFIYHK